MGEMIEPELHPCHQCGEETGSDAMTFCSADCQEKWRGARAPRLTMNGSPLLWWGQYGGPR